MRTTLLLGAASTLILLLLAGCAGVPLLGGNSAGACDPILFIREGSTTQNDVSARCGPPTSRQHSNSGTNWIYDPDISVSTGDVLATGCEGMTGNAYNLCIASLPAKLYMNINFDRNGIVTDYTARKEARQPTPRPNAQ